MNVTVSTIVGTLLPMAVAFCFGYQIATLGELKRNIKEVEEIREFYVRTRVKKDHSNT